MRCKENSFINNNKPVIYGNNTNGVQLSTKAVSVMRCIFGLLDATKLELTYFYATKVTFAFEFTFERICKLKFAFGECEV